MCGKRHLILLVSLVSCHFGLASGLPDSTWQITPLRQLNSIADEILIGWDGEEIYFGRLNTSWRREKGMQGLLSERDDFTARRLRDWSEFEPPNPTQLVANRFPSWEALGEIQHAAMDPDRGVVVLSVWMEEGHFDLFMAQREGSGWSIPTPLDGLNSSKNEIFPNFIGGDLLFGSDRLGGQGGFDVYQAKRMDLFSKAVALPAPLNTIGDEFNAVPGGDKFETGFYISAIPLDGQGGIDLLWIAPPPEKSLADPVELGMEIRYQREPLIDLDVQIRRRGGGHVFSGALDTEGRIEIGSIILDAALAVRFESNNRKRRALPNGAVCHVYERCESGSCLNSSWPGWKHIRSYSLTGGEAFVFDLLPLDSFGHMERPSDIDESLLNKTGDTWEGVFDSNEASLSKNDQQDLINWLRSYQKNEGQWSNDLKLLAEGHADASGTREGNEHLSLQRAQHVAEIAAKAGIAIDRVKAIGYGSAFASGQDVSDRRVIVRWVLD